MVVCPPGFQAYVKGAVPQVGETVALPILWVQGVGVVETFATITAGCVIVTVELLEQVAVEICTE